MHVSDAVVSVVLVGKGGFNNGVALVYLCKSTHSAYNMGTLCVGRGSGDVPHALVRGPNSISGGAIP